MTLTLCEGRNVESAMITIGDLAKLGRVSVRMLRQYDSIGLLIPMRTDADSGYRFYEVDQVELESQIRNDQYRLARLRLIESEDTMSTPVVTTKHVSPATTFGLRGLSESATLEHVGPVIQPLYGRVMQALGEARMAPAGPALAYYQPAKDHSPDAVWIDATVPVAAASVNGLETFSIPDGEVASLIHLGSMNSIDSTYQTLNRWVTEQGHTLTGQAREIYLEMPTDESDWVTEVQVYFTR